MNTILIAIIASLATGLGGYLYGNNVGHDQEKAKQAKLEDVATQAAEKTAGIAADAISKIKVQKSTIVQKATHEIQTRVEYADCKHTDGMLGTINQALTGRRASKGIVPANDATLGSKLRSDDAEASGGGLRLPGMSSSARP